MSTQPLACTIAFGTAGTQRVGGEPDAGLLEQLAGRADHRRLAALQQAGGQRPAAAGRLAQQQDPARLGGLGVADQGDRADDVLRHDQPDQPAAHRHAAAGRRSGRRRPDRRHARGGS